MNRDELFEAVREVNNFIIQAEKDVKAAHARLKKSLPLLLELLNATREQSTQSSLEDFGKGLSLEDVRKMLMEG